MDFSFRRSGHTHILISTHSLVLLSISVFLIRYGSNFVSEAIYTRFDVNHEPSQLMMARRNNNVNAIMNAEWRERNREREEKIFCWPKWMGDIWINLWAKTNTFILLLLFLSLILLNCQKKEVKKRVVYSACAQNRVSISKSTDFLDGVNRIRCALI